MGAIDPALGALRLVGELLGMAATASSNGLAKATGVSHLDAPADFSLLERAEEMLSAARTIDEVKSIRDKGVAAAAYVRKARLGVQNFNHCYEIILRAERRAGAMLKAMGGGVNGGDRKSVGKNPTDFDSIAPSDERKRFYRLESIPEKDFKRHITEATTRGERLAMSGVLKLAKKNEKQEAIEIRTEAAVSHGVVKDLSGLVSSGAKFGTIYADPPWAYSNKATRSNVDSEYAKTMTVDEICAEPVSQLAAEKCHLHLWTTNAFLFEAKRVLESWGFEYKSCFIWVKPQMGIGNYWRVSHEFMLLGVKGGLTFLDHAQKSWMQFDRTKHSRKPKEIREIIEKVSPGPYLEMYGRQLLNEKWTVYGNEVEEPGLF